MGIVRWSSARYIDKKRDVDGQKRCTMQAKKKTNNNRNETNAEIKRQGKQNKKPGTKGLQQRKLAAIGNVELMTH